VESSARNDVYARVVTVPNALSFIRLALVPGFLVLIIAGQDLLALVVLVISSATDYLDGVFARKLRQITRLGQLLDPAADRLFIFAALIGLAWRELIPWWFVVIVVGRDALLLILGIVLANFGYGPLPVHTTGKIATLCLYYALPIIMIGHAFANAAIVTDPLGWAFAIWGAFLYWWAGVIYLIEARRVIKISLVAGAASSDTLRD
jgi:cardiolipin synthase